MEALYTGDEKCDLLQKRLYESTLVRNVLSSAIDRPQPFRTFLQLFFEGREKCQYRAEVPFVVVAFFQKRLQHVESLVRRCGEKSFCIKIRMCDIHNTDVAHP